MSMKFQHNRTSNQKTFLKTLKNKCMIPTAEVLEGDRHTTFACECAYGIILSLSGLIRDVSTLCNYLMQITNIIDQGEWKMQVECESSSSVGGGGNRSGSGGWDGGDSALVLVAVVEMVFFVVGGGGGTGVCGMKFTSSFGTQIKDAKIYCMCSSIHLSWIPQVQRDLRLGGWVVWE